MRKTILIVCIVALALSAQVYLVSPVYAGKPSPPTGEKLPWGVDRIDADRVWDKDGNLVVDPGANTGLGIKVAVLDTGVSYHPDLNVTHGRNFVDLPLGESDNNYDDIDGHGTAIAGIIAAVDNEEGYIGVGPGIDIYAVRFIKYKGGPVAPDVGTNYAVPANYKYTDLYEAMRWCIDNKMQVISMSFGIWTVKDASLTAVAPLHDPNFYRLIKEAYDKGIVIVSAAGNGVGVTNYNGRSIQLFANPSETGNPFVPESALSYDFPVSYGEVITVSATGIRTTKGKPGERQTVDYFPAFSNFGPKIDLAAPGVAVEVPTKSGGYGLFSGTSGAAPHVAAVAALVLKEMGKTNPESGLPKLVRTRLKDKAEILSNLTSDQQGAGLVDAENSVLGSWPAPPRQPKLSVTWGEIKVK